MGKLNQYTQGYLTAVDVNGGTGYITAEGLKILDRRRYEGATVSAELSDGKVLSEGFSQQEAVSLTAAAAAAKLRSFTETYQSSMNAVVQTSRMLYRLKQAEEYFMQDQLDLAECMERVNQIGEVGEYLCGGFKNGSISVSRDMMGEMLTDLYETLRYSAAVCVCFSECKKDVFGGAEDFAAMAEAKNSGDPLVRSAYIRGEQLQRRGAAAMSAKEYGAAAYYDLMLRNLSLWGKALLKGDSSVYELFQIKDDVLCLEGASDFPNETVTMTVRKSDSAGQWDYVGQTKTDENGEYIFSYKMKNGSGLYILSVRAADSAVYRREFAFFSKSDEEGLISALRRARDESDLLKAVAEYEALLGLYSGELACLTEENTAVLACILSNRAAITNVEQLVQITREALLSDELSHAVSPETVGDIIEQYGYLLQLEGRNAWKTCRNALSEAARTAVLGDLAGKEYASAKETAEAFDTAVVLRGTQYSSYRELMAVLTANNDLLGIDFSDYESLGAADKNSVLKAIAGKRYASVDAIREDFEETAAESLNQKHTSKPSGSGGGGGGRNDRILDGISVNAPQPADEPPKKERFADLSGYQWASEAITALCERNVVNGVGGNLFEPYRPVKREEFVKMIVLALEIEAGSGSVSFDDVPADSWALPYICAAVECGIITGQSEARFGCGMEITREDAAVILYRAARLKGIAAGAEKEDFVDFDTVSDYAKEAVSRMSGAGVIHGMEDGSFRPGASANRAQAAKLIYELMKRAG